MEEKQLVITKKNTLAVLFILVGIISIVFSGVFLYEGFDKSKLITREMQSENITYTSAGGEIAGVIDNPAEAIVMAGVLKEHRSTRYGAYTTLKNGDPNRDQILKAMTMENALNLAVLGYGVTDVVKASSAFMGLTGLLFTVAGVVLARSPRVKLE